MRIVLSMSTALVIPHGPEWEWSDRLRKVRRAIAGVTAAEMADKMGVKLSTYQSWEAGRSEPPYRDIVEFSEIIHNWWPDLVSIQWMLGLAPRMMMSDDGSGNQVVPVAEQAILRTPSPTPPVGNGHVASIAKARRRQLARVSQLPRVDSNHEPSDGGTASWCLLGEHPASPINHHPQPRQTSLDGYSEQFIQQLKQVV